MLEGKRNCHVKHATSRSKSRTGIALIIHGLIPARGRPQLSCQTGPFSARFGAHMSSTRCLERTCLLTDARMTGAFQPLKSSPYARTSCFRRYSASTIGSSASTRGFEPPCFLGETSWALGTVCKALDPGSGSDVESSSESDSTASSISLWFGGGKHSMAASPLPAVCFFSQWHDQA